MSLSFTVVSIGALSRNRFWDEAEPKRVAHATTTLVRDGNKTILVDPGLPAQVLAQRLDERTGLKPEQIDVVFLTNFRPVHRRALEAFSRATWLMHGAEMEAVREHLDRTAASLRDAQEQSAQAAGVEQRDLEAMIRQERDLLDRIHPADDKLTRRVHLFPSPGATPGAASLLLTELSRTVMVVGDAVISRDYFEAGRVFEQVYDLEAAQASMSEILEIADVIVPGHDNVFMIAGR
jgi:glyoxylase-like metal-dependent hydrolase (beta-lactamase superfamily II)